MPGPDTRASSSLRAMTVYPFSCRYFRWDSKTAVVTVMLSATVGPKRW
jgi:hypothetical protein